MLQVRVLVYDMVSILEDNARSSSPSERPDHRWTLSSFKVAVMRTRRRRLAQWQARRMQPLVAATGNGHEAPAEEQQQQQQQQQQGGGGRLTLAFSGRYPKGRRSARRPAMQAAMQRLGELAQGLGAESNEPLGVPLVSKIPEAPCPGQSPSSCAAMPAPGLPSPPHPLDYASPPLLLPLLPPPPPPPLAGSPVSFQQQLLQSLNSASSPLLGAIQRYRSGSSPLSPAALHTPSPHLPAYAWPTPNISAPLPAVDQGPTVPSVPGTVAWPTPLRAVSQGPAAPSLQGMDIRSMMAHLLRLSAPTAAAPFGSFDLGASSFGQQQRSPVFAPGSAGLFGGTQPTSLGPGWPSGSNGFETHAFNLGFGWPGTNSGQRMQLGDSLLGSPVSGFGNNLLNPSIGFNLAFAAGHGDPYSSGPSAPGLPGSSHFGTAPLVDDDVVLLREVDGSGSGLQQLLSGANPVVMGMLLERWMSGLDPKSRAEVTTAWR